MSPSMTIATRLLAPVDFSEPSGAATAYAADLAAQTGATLSLLHAIPPAPFDYAMVGPSAQVLNELSDSRRVSAQARLDRLSVPLGQVRRLVAEGHPATEILRVAESERIDLIVMSTRGANAIEQVLGIGSLTLRILAGAKCPVLTGTHFEGPPPVEGGNIICALDLGPSAGRTLGWAARAAREFGARLTIVHATTLGDQKRAGLVQDSWDSGLTGRTVQHFRDLLDAEKLDGDVIIDDHGVHRLVAATAERLKAGWVVVGRSADADVRDRLRAHTYDIVRRSPCPVVSV